MARGTTKSNSNSSNNGNNNSNHSNTRNPTANSQQKQQHRRGPSGNRARDLLDMGWFWWSWCLCLCLWLGWGVAGGVFRRCKDAHRGACACACGLGGGWRGVFLGDVKTRTIDIISFRLSYLSKSKVPTSNSPSRPPSLDTTRRRGRRIPNKHIDEH